MNHHYPRQKKYDAERDRASEALRQASYPPLDDLGEYLRCHECGHELRGRVRVCEHCGAHLGITTLEASPDPAQIAEAAARLREHSRAQMAGGRRVS